MIRNETPPCLPKGALHVPIEEVVAGGSVTSWSADDEGIFLWDVDIASGPGAKIPLEGRGFPTPSDSLPDLDLASLYFPRVSSPHLCGWGGRAATLSVSRMLKCAELIWHVLGRVTLPCRHLFMTTGRKMAGEE